jgi:hypothetical protein
MIKPTVIHGITNTKHRDIWNFVLTQHSCENIIITPINTCHISTLCHSGKHFIFRWPCISLQFFANDQFDSRFYICIYWTSLHVSSITVLIIRRSNCINTSSGMISLFEWLLGIQVRTGISLFKFCIKLEHIFLKSILVLLYFRVLYLIAWTVYWSQHFIFNKLL